MALNGAPPALDPDRFEGEVDGRRTCLITLRNRRGMVLNFTNLGAKVMQILVPDRHGDLDDVALGYDCLQAVIQGHASMGAFIGRYANRIAHARFVMDGVEHRLQPNSNGHSLHGGPRGSRHRVFDVSRHDDRTAVLRLRYETAVDGFPGNVESRVIYRLTEANEFVIQYEAECDASTVVSMTSHVFFNLAGHCRISEASLARHRLLINADLFTPCNADHVPTGELRSVAGTPMDFRRMRTIGERIDEVTRDVAPGVGYDHNWVLRKPAGQLGLAARVHEPASGRTLEVLSTEPGLVFYSGNNLNASDVAGKQGLLYARRSGLCLEPGRYPDSPNQPGFPSAVLRPGEQFVGTIVYRFGAEVQGRSGEPSRATRQPAVPGEDRD